MVRDMQDVPTTKIESLSDGELFLSTGRPELRQQCGNCVDGIGETARTACDYGYDEIQD